MLWKYIFLFAEKTLYPRKNWHYKFLTSNFTYRYMYIGRNILPVFKVWTLLAQKYDETLSNWLKNSLGSLVVSVTTLPNR
jgi:hypothetical protein